MNNGLQNQHVWADACAMLPEFPERHDCIPSGCWICRSPGHSRSLGPSRWQPARHVPCASAFQEREKRTPKLGRGTVKQTPTRRPPSPRRAEIAEDNVPWYKRAYINITGFPFPLGPLFSKRTIRYEVRRLSSACTCGRLHKSMLCACYHNPESRAFINSGHPSFCHPSSLMPNIGHCRHGVEQHLPHLRLLTRCEARSSLELLSRSYCQLTSS